MNIQKIIISTLITIFWLFFTLSITYLNTQSWVNTFSIPEVSLWYSELIWSGSSVYLKPIDAAKIQEGKTVFDQLNYIDSVVLNWKTYSKQISGKNVNLNIWEWLYIFDLYDISYNYSIKNKDFLIQPKSPWKFFVDSRNGADIKIFSFDAIININLLSAQSQENMTSLVMYPHMFFGFNSTRNKFLKNADILRIESVSKIFYVTESFLNDTKQLNQSFFKRLYPVNDQTASKFFDYFFKFSYSSTEFDKYNINTISSVLYKDKSLLWIWYIEKYFTFFLNKEKKSVYYKKSILSNLNRLFWEKISNTTYDEVKNDIIADLKSLKEVNQSDFQDFQTILSFYYKNLLKINSIDYIKSTIVLSQIISSVSEKNTFQPYASSFYLNRIYALVDNQTYSNNYLQQNLFIFLQYFLQENNLQLKDGELLIDENQEIILSLDYLSYFLKNILLYNVSFSDTLKFDNLLSIINIYLWINKNIIAYYKNPGRTETLIVEYQMILNKFLLEMRRWFFTPELNDRWLLILNSNNSLNSAQVIQLDIVMNAILDFYNKNRGVLSEKNMNYNSLYSKNKVTYSEYYSALINHPEYLIKYDKVKSDLLSAQTVFEKWQTITLNQDMLVSYLSQFQWVDVSNMSYKIIWNKYYQLSNLFINGENFSFYLYPSEFSRIDEITKNGQRLSGSYELDNLKQDLAVVHKQAPEKEKYKYDFSRFFLNTFFNNQTVTSKVYSQAEENDKVEDRTITFFKRDKLFWDKWDFSILNRYLDIKYDDVDVELNTNNQYNILINRWVVSTQLTLNGASRQIVWILRSEYVFSDTDHFFRNIYITFYDPSYYAKWEEVFLFWWKEFRIVRKIDIVKFKEEMNKEIERIFMNN